jgi:hypothetical protein
MELKELVAPLNLCKLIPKGEFEDCVLCWVDLREQFTISVNPYVTARELSNRDVSKIGIPAPTLQEIMENTPFIDVYINVSKEYTTHLRYGSRCREHFRDKSGATAALKLWLKMKGIDYEK